MKESDYLIRNTKIICTVRNADEKQIEDILRAKIKDLRQHKYLMRVAAVEGLDLESMPLEELEFQIVAERQLNENLLAVLVDSEQNVEVVKTNLRMSAIYNVLGIPYEDLRWDYEPFLLNLSHNGKDIFSFNQAQVELVREWCEDQQIAFFRRKKGCFGESVSIFPGSADEMMLAEGKILLVGYKENSYCSLTDKQIEECRKIFSRQSAVAATIPEKTKKEIGSETDMKQEKMEIPLWEKAYLTIEEAAMYFGIGQAKLRALANDDKCPFVLWNGSKRLFKRRKMEEFLDKEYSI